MGTETDCEGTRAGYRATWIGALVNIALIAIKALAGWLGNSQALLADAAHSASDLLTDAIVVVGLFFGRRPPDQDHHFGHRRIETLATGGVGVSLVAAAIYLGYESALAISNNESSQPTWLAVSGAFVSIVVKEVLYRYTVHVGRRIGSASVVANAWHHRSDALSSIAVLVGVAGARLNPDWQMLDAYAALLVAVLIAKVGAEVLLGALKEMVDAAPPADVVEQLRAACDRVPGVQQVHDLKMRSTGGVLEVQVHIVVDGGIPVRDGHRIADAAAAAARAAVPTVGSVIVHVDPDVACDA